VVEVVDEVDEPVDETVTFSFRYIALLPSLNERRPSRIRLISQSYLISPANTSFWVKKSAQMAPETVEIFIELSFLI
jgi:hypothetical protein